MNKIKFKELLKSADRKLALMKAELKGGLDFKDVDVKQLDLGQKEILMRLEVEEDYYCDAQDDCEGCGDMWLGRIDYACKTIGDYLSGKLTGAQEVMCVSYMKIDRSNSQTIFLILEDRKPKVASFKNELSEAINLELKKQQVDKLEGVKLPKNIAGYELLPEKSYRTAFLEEL